MREEDECPICHSSLSYIEEGEKEAHVASCIEKSMGETTSHSKQTPSNIITCPICNISLSSKQFDGNEAARDAHVAACLDSQQSSSSSSDANQLPPAYENKGSQKNTYKHGAAEVMTQKRESVMFEKFKENAAQSKGKEPMTDENALKEKEGSSLRKWFSSIVGDSKSSSQKQEDNVADANALMRQRWGPEDSPVSILVTKYIIATRMQQHWEYLGSQHPRQFKKYLLKGYMEPIPTRWVQNRQVNLSNPHVLKEL